MASCYRLWKAKSKAGVGTLNAAVWAMFLVVALGPVLAQGQTQVQPQLQTQGRNDLLMLNLGEAPQKTLRYLWAQAQKESMSVRSTWHDALRGQKSVLQTRFELEITGVNSSGEFEIAAKLNEATLGSSAEAKDVPVALQGLIGKTQTLRITAQGQVLQNNWMQEALTEKQANLYELKVLLAQSAQAFSFRLPNQAIGQQGEWESKGLSHQLGSTSALQIATQAQVRTFNGDQVGISLLRSTRLIFDGNTSQLDQLGQLTEIAEGIVQLDLRRMVPPLYRFGTDFEVKF
jgi:hypothetical protein